MKQFFGVAVLVFMGIAAWRISEQLSADALSMALGILFGVMASIPTALIVLAARRREDDYMQNRTSSRRQPQGQMPQPYVQQPPVIVLAGNGTVPQMPGGIPNSNGYAASQQGCAQPIPPALPAPQETIETRQFRVVGEKDEWVEEW